MYNLIGQRFGKLFVLKKVKTVNKSGAAHWLCHCDCGVSTIVASQDLRRNHTQSCGCYRVQYMKDRQFKHGLSKTKEYKSWDGMIRRCYDESNTGYKDYGGRGITVCDTWRNSFEKFREDMGICPKGYSIDRIDNNLGYLPSNCRWATRDQQSNNKRNNKYITLNAESLTLAQWARRLGINEKSVRSRVSRGWSSEDALTVPMR